MTLDYFYGQSGELFSYFRIPKALFQDCRFRQLSTDARTLYGILLDRMSLSAKNGWLDEQGRVYIIYTVREVQESLCCGEHKAVKLFRELEDIDLIERKRRGLGRPSLIYVKDFSSGLPKAQVQNCTNSNSGAAESAILEQPKLQANKTDKNKTEWNDPDPIYSGGIREQLEDYFYQALEVDLLLRLCPDDEDTIYQIVDLLVDTCSTKRKMLRIAGDDKPTEVVRSRLKKLNADHIRFVLDSLAENTAPVRNMKQYLLAMLYNAPTTMNLYEVKRGKHTAVKGKGQKRFIRFRTLGIGYGEDEIKAVLEGKAKHHPYQKQPPKEQPFQLLVDIQGKMAAGKSVGYKKWATKFNLKEMSKTLLFLQEQKISSAEELRERAATATERYHAMGDSIKAAEARLTEITVLKTHIINYAKTREVYATYRKAGYSKAFLEAHREEIALHKAAKAAFDEAGLQKLPKVKALDAEFAELLTKKKAAYPEYRKARNEMQELVRAQKNVERFFAEEKDTTEKTQTR